MERRPGSDGIDGSKDWDGRAEETQKGRKQRVKSDSELPVWETVCLVFPSRDRWRKCSPAAE